MTRGEPLAVCVAGATGWAGSELARAIAQSIADGKVVGLCHGRMEWGPRALGNRSILADPRRAEMKDVVNHAVKLREGFRPFAPAVLHEEADAWFDLSGLGGESPYMLFAVPVRGHVRARIPPPFRTSPP